MLSTVGTKTFVRGEIKEDERFFIVLQEEFANNNSNWSNNIINYYSVSRNNNISFVSGVDSGEPLYFTAKLKNKKIKLRIMGEDISPAREIIFSSSKNLEENKIFAGVWCVLFFEKDIEHVPWGIISPEERYLSDKNNLKGSNINGYFTKIEGNKSRRLSGERQYRYCFVPEFYKINDTKKKSFPIFKEWVIHPDISYRGFTLSENDNEWYEYSSPDRSIGPGKVRPGKAGTNKISSKKRELKTFSDLENEKKNDRTPLEKFLSLFTTTNTRDNGNNSSTEEFIPVNDRNFKNTTPSTNNDSDGGSTSGGGVLFFIFAFLLGCLITLIISYFILSASSGRSEVKSQKIKSV